MNREQFEQIFSDAHVVDIDLSRWDEELLLYVLADHAERVEEGRKPLFAVEFRRVSRLSVEFLHLNFEPQGENEHFQWMVDDFSIEPTSTGFDIALWGLTSTPRLEVSCADVLITPVPLRILDELFPGWDEPSQPFVRPSIEVWSRIFDRSKHTKKR